MHFLCCTIVSDCVHAFVVLSYCFRLCSCICSVVLLFQIVFMHF